ncbi:MAG: formylglycine-generating enzyme family protein, partial [Planctomycetota bacterium]
TNNGMVKIEFSNSKAQVEVKVDGEVIDIGGMKEPLRLKVGEHDLLVTSGDYQSVSKSFTVRRGQEEILRVTLEPKIKPAEPLPTVKVAKSTWPTKPHQATSETKSAGPAITVGKISPNNPVTNMSELSVELGGGVKLDLVLIPAGSFTMGDDNARRPVHKVSINKPFYLGKYEVTQEQWEAVMGSNPSFFKGPKNPVEKVSWNDCQQFLVNLNAKAGGQGGKFVLPTEAQWEYACRAGSTTHYSFGDEDSELGKYAWYGANSNSKTHPVGEKKPNAWRLYDMHGNVWEWCADSCDSGQFVDSPAPIYGSTNPTTGSDRVYRGGCWSYPALNCWSAYRNSYKPGNGLIYLGLRVARVPADTVTETRLPESAPPPKIKPISPQTIEVEKPPSLVKTQVVDLGGGVKLDLVLIPAGSFKMGDDSEKPVHKVTITKPFCLGKYEVTQEQWEAVMGNNPSRFKDPKNPVEQVSWDDCQQFLVKLNAKVGGQGGKFVLPTEAQWEYACRAGSTGKFCFGDDEEQLGEYAWYSSNSGSKTHPVGEKKPNAFGLYDMHGNVWEWCQDWYGTYGAEAVDDPSGPTTGSNRVNRGGGWRYNGWHCQSAYRFINVPGYRHGILGFRVSRVPAD